LDGKGNKIGVPIKASSIYNKPTLNFLEEKFKRNEPLKAPFKKNLKTSIDWVLVNRPRSLQAFKMGLERNKINLIIRQNEAGIIYGLTYIDHNTKSVLNGSDIGKEYSAKEILEKCELPQLTTEQKTIHPNNSPGVTMSDDFENQKSTNKDLSKLLDAVIAPTEDCNYIPYDLRKNKKKKRKHK
jgi:hypothetical protein